MKGKLLLFVATALVGSILLFDYLLKSSAANFALEAKDPFLDPEVIKSQEYLSSSLARGLVSLTPMCEGHCLIIPKRHVVRFEDLTSEEIVEMAYITKRTHEAVRRFLGPCDYLLLQKNGPNVGQNISHLYTHYIPRPLEQTSILGLVLKFLWPMRSKLSKEEMQKRVGQMKKALSEKKEIPSFCIEDPFIDGEEPINLEDHDFSKSCSF